MSKKALFLVGSPKGEKSTSNALGSYLMDRLAGSGIETEKLILVKAMKTDDGIADLLSRVDAADLLILASPLYVDQFPAFVIRAMERIYGHKKSANTPKKQRLLAIVNCGFPEAEQNICASAISKVFARKAGMDWAGCLCIGMGAAINGASLDTAGGKVKRLKKGLQLAAEALANDRPVPGEAKALASKPFLPIVIVKRIIYPYVITRSWNKIAKANGVLDKMYDRPYG